MSGGSRDREKKARQAWFLPGFFLFGGGSRYSSR